MMGQGFGWAVGAQDLRRLVLLVLALVGLAVVGCALLPCCRLPLLGGYEAGGQRAEAVTGTARVVDGDTLDVEGQRVRLHGIDAPELRQQCQSAEGPVPCGVVSRDHLERLIAGRDVKCEVRDRDRYGRFVAVCRIIRRPYRQRSTDLGGAMVEEGMAIAYRRYSTDYVDEEDSARMDRRGLWAYEFEAPEDYRRGSR